MYTAEGESESADAALPRARDGPRFDRATMPAHLDRDGHHVLISLWEQCTSRVSHALLLPVMGIKPTSNTRKTSDTVLKMQGGAETRDLIMVS